LCPRGPLGYLWRRWDAKPWLWTAICRSHAAARNGRNTDPGHHQTISGPLKPKLWLRKDIPIGKAPIIFPTDHAPGLYRLDDSLGGFLGLSLRVSAYNSLLQVGGAILGSAENSSNKYLDSLPPVRPGVITFECLWADLGQERKSHRCGTVEKCLASCAGEWHRYVGGLPRA